VCGFSRPAPNKFKKSVRIKNLKQKSLKTVLTAVVRRRKKKRRMTRRKRKMISLYRISLEIRLNYWTAHA